MRVYGLTIWYLVPGFTRLPQPSECAVSMDVQCHSKKEDDLTHQETRIKEPRCVVVYKVCEVPALHVAVHDAEEEGTKHWNKGSAIALHQQRIDEHPAGTRLDFRSLTQQNSTCCTCDCGSTKSDYKHAKALQLLFSVVQKFSLHREALSL